MSRFTGKEVCVYSDFYMFGNEEGDKTDWSNQHIKIYNPKTKEYEPLEIKETKDIVPYFAHMVGCGAYYSDENGKAIRNICISSVPYYVTEERERLECAYDDIRIYIHRCMRKKETPVFEDFMSHSWMWKEYTKEKNEYIYNLLNEIFNRVKEHPFSKKNKILKGLYFRGNLQEHYKKELYEEMLKYGYTEEEAHEWVYEHWYKE